MTIIAPAALERALLRGMRPDAHLFVRPDWRRHVRPGFEDDLPFALYEQKYRPDQPRVPAGSREGGQWTDDESGPGPAVLTSADGDAASRSPLRIQYTEREKSNLAEIMLSKGGENIGSFGDRISVVKGPNISHQESHDPESGRTILSFTGIGSVVVDENDGVVLTGNVYGVGTVSRPDKGLSIVIDRNGKARAYTTVGS